MPQRIPGLGMPRASIPGIGVPRTRFSVGNQMMNQADQLLRKGVGGSGQRFDKIRQRHIWSAYTFHSAAGGAISAAGVLAAGEYPVFVTPIGQNGQGYPGGLTLTLRDTNVPGVNRVSDNQNFAIWELGVSVLPLRQDVVAALPANMAQGSPSPIDVDQICGNAVLAITYLTNRVVLGPVGVFAAPGTPHFAAPTLLDFAGNENVAGDGGGLNEGVGAPPWDARQARWANIGGSVPPAPALRRKMKVPIFLQSGDTFSFSFTFARPTQFLTVAQGGTGGFVLRLDWWAVESFREQG